MRRLRHAVVVMALVAGTAGVPGTAAAATGTPLAVKAVVASGDDGNVPANTIDGDLGTRWSAEGDGVWIRYDLGTPQVVGSVSLAWHKGDTRRDTFDVQLSDDGTSWKTVLSRKTTSGTSLALQNNDFTDASGRYVRVVGHGNTSNEWTSVTETTVHGADGSGGGGGTCAYPADVLDLRNWYVGLPVGEKEKPLNVYQPQLATYSIDPWFRAADDCAAVQFRAAVNGVTTSGSSYPRSELREMSGSAKASWSSTSGTHTMVVDQAITAAPNQHPNVVAGQIHDSEDDVSVFRLEGTRLYVTKDDDKHTLVDGDYRLGTRFRAKFEVRDGVIKVYYNDVLKATIAKKFSGAYFKAGAYTQANCGKSSPCGDANYGEVKIYGLSVTHSDNPSGS